MIQYVGQGGHRAETIGVLGLEVVGKVDEAATDAARALTNQLRARASEGPYVVAPNSAQELIDQKLIHNCPDSRRDCMAKIGRALGADHLLYGRIQHGPRGDYRASLQLLDVGSGRAASWNGLVSPGPQLADQARRAYGHLLSGDQRNVADRVLIEATNETFWRLTRYKPGRQLDMSDPQDRAMSKRWLDIYAEVRGHRARATQLAQRTVNELVTPYVLVVEQRDGTLRPQTFERSGNLDVQYAWLVDQPDYYTYAAMFDFTQDRTAPIADQFSLSRRQQMATSGWYGW